MGYDVDIITITKFFSSLQHNWIHLNRIKCSHVRVFVKNTANCSKRVMNWFARILSAMSVIKISLDSAVKSISV